MTYSTSTSGFISLTPAGVSQQFTDFEEIPAKGFNVLVRAKRRGQYWVLKGLKPEFRDTSTYQILLKKEYDILRNVQHSGIVAVEGMEEVDGYGLCIVMEWIDGETLDQWLSHKHTMQEKRKIVAQLFAAVEFVHCKQVVHRDLKPANIMITNNGHNVKIIDFGLADTDNYAIFKQPAGTKGFISPEQSAGSTPDSRNDIYSLGSILALMDMGVCYRRIVRRCHAPIDKRYADIYAINRDIQSCRFLRRVVAVLLFFMLVLGSAGVIYNYWFAPEQTYSTVADFKIGYLRYQSWGGGLVSVQSTEDIDSCIEIPCKAAYHSINYQVNEIGIKAFHNHHNLKWTVLPDCQLHILHDAFTGCNHLEGLYFRSSVPYVIGNPQWPTDIHDVFDASHFSSVVIYVPKGSANAWRKSAWGVFKNIKEFSCD